MGGNAKHMPHIWEHYDATFEDVFSLLESLTVGNIYATEKFDGVNIHFRVDNTGVVKFSRSAADIATGGFTFKDALRIYESHPARETFIEGFRAIDEHFSDQWWPFGYSGRNWVNAEIISSTREQLLKYDENAIVMHQVVTFPISGNKYTDPVKSSRLSEFAKPPIVTASGQSWAVMPPVEVQLKNDAGAGYLTEAKDRLVRCMHAANLNEKSTLRQFMRYSLLSGPISRIRTTQAIKEKLADKISGTNPSIRLVDLKKNQPAGVAGTISFYGQVKNQQKHQRAAMLPIVNTVDAFAASRLREVRSCLIENVKLEQDRISDEIKKAAALVNETADGFQEERIQMFNDFFNEWSQVCTTPAAIEGITFDFAGSPTKITGGFATLNQLLGITRYGRGNVPAVITESSPAQAAGSRKDDVTISPGWFATG